MLFLDAWDSVRLRTTSTQWNVPRRYGPYCELFFFLLEKEPMVLRELIRLGPSIQPYGELLFLLGGTVRKLQGAQKAKAFWKMKAAKDAGEENCDPTREDDTKEETK